MKANGIHIWKNDQGRLAFSFNQAQGFPEPLKAALKQQKAALLEILSCNRVHSEEKFRALAFYKLPAPYRDTALSPIQKGIYLQSKLDAEGYTYTIPLLFRLKQGNAELLKKALRHVLMEHPILRIRVDEHFRYRLLDSSSIPIRECEISIDDVKAICEQSARTLFNLDGGALIAPEVLRLKGQDELLLNLSHHHVLTDAYSAGLLQSEILSAYTELCQHKKSEHPIDLARAVDYLDYIAYQYYELQTERYQQAIAHLSQQLDCAEKLQLRHVSAHTHKQGCGRFEFNLDTDIHKTLKQLALVHQTSVYAILLGGLYQVLSLYAGGQRDFPIGLTVSNRPSELNRAIGPFINTLPLIPDWRPTDRFIRNIQRIHQDVMYLNEHHQINLNLLTERLKRSHADIVDLMQVVLTLHNFKAENKHSTLMLEPIPVSEAAEKFGISLIAQETPDTLRFTVSHSNARYPEWYVKALMDTFTALLATLDSHTLDQPTFQLKVLNQKSYQKTVQEWNRTERDFWKNSTLHSLFEAQAEKTPDRIAVIYDDRRLSYRALNESANRLAHYLRCVHKFGADNLVGLCLDRSEQVLIAILGVLKAGAAYVPIEPSYPAARIRYIVEDANLSLLLVNEAPLEKLADYLSIKQVFVDSKAFQETLSLYPSSNPEQITSPTHLAYVIYTSGTTGHPKGVLIEHRSAAARIQWINELCPLQAEDRILQKTSYAFDVSVWELLWPIQHGGCLVFAKPNGHKDAHYLIDLIRRESITILSFVPSMLSAFTEALQAQVLTHDRPLPSLKHLFCGGEALKWGQAKKWHDLLPHTKLHNLYGPTEVTMHALYYAVSNINDETICIGTPIANTTAYILDPHLNPLPIGAPGEIHIGGIGLARGYLNQPELTKERFIPNPFQTAEEKAQGQNARLYKTGDLGRWLPEGNIEFLGRNDFQVKLRGYRIELGEIEQALSTCEGIQNSVVLLKTPKEENGTAQPYLIGYYVSPEPLNETWLFEHLQARLPETMIPSRLVHLAQLPLTPNGKLDRQALPDPGFVRDHTRRVAPRTALESQLCALWGEVLGISHAQIGIQDDFFRLGGDSILSIQLVSRMRRQLNLELSVQDVFRHKTIERLHEQVLKPLLHHKTQSLGLQRKQGKLDDEMSLTKVQQKAGEYTKEDFAEVAHEGGLSGLPLVAGKQQLYDWFEMTEIQKAYLIGRLGSYEIGNISNHVYCEYYYKTPLNVEKLEDTLNTLISKFEVLRTVYSLEKLKQRFLKSEEVSAYRVRVNDYSQWMLSDSRLQSVRERLSHKVYDPQRFPLFTFEVSHFKDICVLHVGVDLILLDVQSRLSFLSLIDRLYRQPRDTIPIPSITFKDYQDYCQHLKHSTWYAKNRTYWQERIPQLPLRPRLTSKTEPETIEHPTFAEHTLYIGKTTWAQFKAQARRYGSSYSSVLLGLYGHVLSYFSGHSEFLITLTLFNRYAIHPEVNTLWGDFTSTTLFHYMDFGKDLLKTLKRTHQVMWEDIHHALYPGMRVQRELGKRHKLDVQQAVSPIVFTGLVGGRLDGKRDETPYLEDTEILKKRYWCGQTSQAWIDLQAVEVGSRFMSKWLYVEQLFDSAYIETLNTLYCRFITTLAEQDWETAALSIPYLPPLDQALIEAANAHTQPLSSDTLHSRYQKVLADKTLQQHIAVIDAATGKAYTHGTLQQDSTQLAQILLDQNPPAASPPLIGILSEKGYNQVLAVLAILKSGHAYLPLSIDWPLGRLDEVLTQGQVKLVLISQAQYGREAIRNALSQKYTLRVIETSQADPVPRAATLPEVKADDIAYVIFTSGSTGKPKGVTISHRSALNTIDAVNRRFQITKADKILAVSDLSFDLSVYDLLGLLVAGGTIVFPEPSRSKDPASWVSLIQQHQITLWNSVPQLAALLIDAVTQSPLSQKEAIALASLRLFLLSGDWIPSGLPARLKAQCPEAVLMSLGGATEGSIWSVWYEMDPAKVEGRIPYGVAMPNQQLFVLNPAGEHCPVGVQGEIHIGGLGPARDYWGAPDLTEARFIFYPQLGRLYKTGDLGRFLPDGNIEFLGRNDFQVKLRGHRIELGEIEHTLSTYEGVQNSVVLLKNSKAESGTTQPYLVGYYVSPEPLEETCLFAHLQAKLPEYMVPSRLVHLTELPLTPNGKLDRQALPDPGFVGDRTRQVAPRTELEKQLCALWGEVLDISHAQIGIQDDFFRLGGESILAIQLLSRVRQSLGITLSVQDIFTHRTLESLHAQVLSQIRQRSDQPALQTEQGILEGEAPLLPIQQWFFHHAFPKAHHWNQSFLIRTPPLDLPKLRTALEQLILHHDGFRLRYRQDAAGCVKQHYEPRALPETLKVLDVTSLGAPEGSPVFTSKLHGILTQWQSHFNLSQGPLYEVTYLHGFSDGSSRIWFALHHLIVDAVSWRLITEDLRTLYAQKPLNPKGSSYRQWGQALLHYADTHAEESAYWKAQLADYDAQQNPLQQWIIQQSTPFEASFQLDRARTRQLLKEAHRAYYTQINDLLLAALSQALTALTGHKVHHIVLEGHGRDMLDSTLDVTHTLGWFTTLYPVRLEAQNTLNDSIKTIKEHLRKIPNKGVGYGAVMGCEPSVLPNISFNYLGQLGLESQGPDAWTISFEASGTAMPPENALWYDLNLFGSVRAGQLEFTVSGRLKRDAIQTLAKLFKQQLETLIQETVHAPRSYLTPSDIEDLLSVRELDRLQENSEIEGVYLANSLQQGFIYHALRQGEADETYRVQSVWHYHVPIDAHGLKEAWRLAQEKFSSLRLRFAWTEALVQIVEKTAHLNWQMVDLSQSSDAARRQAIEQLKRQDRKKPYQLDQGNLFRITLVKQRDDLYTCIFNAHHALSDGWSAPILLGFVHETYLELINGETIDLKPDTAFEAAQIYLQAHAQDTQAYWTKALSQLENHTDLSGLLRLEARGVKTTRYTQVQQQAEQRFSVQGDMFRRLKGLGQNAGLTLNAIVQYAWHKTLSVYGGSPQTVVGTVISGRTLPIAGIETSVGLYINTLPLVVHHGATQSLREAILSVQHTLQEMQARSGTPLASLHQGSERLFDNLLIYENMPRRCQEDWQTQLKLHFEASWEKRDYPLALGVTEYPDRLDFKLDYASELFESSSIKALLSTVHALLAQIVEAPEQRLSQLCYLDKKQYQRMVYDWNLCKAACPGAKTFHQVFETQAARYPGKPALIVGDRRLSYQQLNARANQLAHYLLKTGSVSPETRIALCLERNAHLLIGLLAILKAGCAYVPLDPAYPEARIAHILKDSGAQLVLTQSACQAALRVAAPTLNLTVLDSLALQASLSRHSHHNPDVSTCTTHLAYVIYTSGTTGLPKGVMVEHAAFLETLEALRQQYFPGRKGLGTCSLTHVVFDIFALEYSLPWLTGGTLTLGDPLFDRLDCSSYDFMQITPSLCEVKLEQLTHTEHTMLLIGGEPLGSALLGQAVCRFNRVINLYGPTETTVWSTSKSYNSTTGASSLLVSIGKPLLNETVYILDPYLNPLPIGAPGEIHIGGIGLARGYLNQPELTQERFIPNPFQTEEEKQRDQNARLYKTGDLGRFLPDGNIEFLGRNDFQVKLRGHRIELGEIEHALSTCEGVQNSVVLLKTPKAENGPDQPYLVGYYVSPEPLDETQLLQHLQAQLPENMIPSRLMHLTELPLTLNGKLDRGALPDPGFSSAAHYKAPQTAYEKTLAAIWKQVLKQEQVGIHDNFFDLGGNSLLLIQMHSQLLKALHIKLNIMEVFKHPTIARLAQFLASHDSTQVQEKASEGKDKNLGEKPAPIQGAGRPSSAIAIIGMAGRFPGAENLDEFWTNLKAGKAAIQFYTKEELQAAGISPTLLEDPHYVRAQSALSDIQSFDAAFFGYSPREAEIMDPQHRLLMECAWHALEDAGCDPENGAEAIGLYAGTGRNRYLAEHVTPHQPAADLASQYQAMIHNQADYLCTKIAYKLNLKGPAITVQTACSTSLVAVHQACLALTAGDCDMALAGGVSLGQLEKQGYLYQPGMVFSPDGTCRAFDASAQGTIEGQGAGLVLLKPLEQALAAGDPIHAVICASAINNDGTRKIGFTAPSAEKQAAVIRQTQKKAGIQADTIGYIEAHGTGTPLGDPIEIEGLTQAFSQTTHRSQFCAIGSVKTNIGHLDAAAGIAGLIKAILCLKHKTLVPSLHYQSPNPKINFKSSPFYVNTHLKPWASEQTPRRAGVSAFGIGGTNAHILLEEALPVTEAPNTVCSRPGQLVNLSANSLPALSSQARQLRQHLEQHPAIPLEHLAYTLHTGRRRFRYGRSWVVPTVQALHAALDQADSAPSMECLQPRPVVFLFPGQGAQYPGMGAALYASEPRFKAHLDRCLSQLKPHLPATLSEDDILSRTEAVHQTQLTQPALFILEYALARTLMDWDIQPAAMLGHSLGEYVAACLSGVFTLEEGLALIAERGRLLQRTQKAQMLAVPLSQQETARYLEGSALDLAVVNHETSCVVSGPVSQIEPFARKLAQIGIPSTTLKVSRAFHSRSIDCVLPEFRQALQSVKLSHPQRPFISNVSGHWVDAAEVANTDYWLKHTRNPVLFAQGLDCLLTAEGLENSLLVELGPSQVLTGLVRRHPRCKAERVLPLMRRERDQESDSLFLLKVLGRLWAAGVDIDWSSFYQYMPKRRIPLPVYPFEKTAYWLPSARATAQSRIGDRPVQAETVHTYVVPEPEPLKETPSPATDDISQTVKMAWQRVLGVPAHSPDEDFFESGGDSLAAVQLASQIQKQLGFSVSLMRLKKPTVHEMINALWKRRMQDKPAGIPNHRRVIILQQGLALRQTPLVLIHPIGGDIYFYRYLVNDLPESLPVYAVRSPMLDGGKPFKSIEAMAEAYLQALEAAQLAPPYALGGASFGGIVAWQMAQVLASKGHTPPLLVLIDSPAYGHLPPPMSDEAILAYLVKYNLERLQISPETLQAQGSLQAQLHYLADQAKDPEWTELLSPDFLSVFIRTWQAHGVLMHQYKPLPYAGPVVFFSHTERIAEFPTEQHRHWRVLTKGDFRHFQIPGNHISMNAKPNAGVIAQHLKTIMSCLEILSHEYKH